jgi:hypothetical protein
MPLFLKKLQEGQMWWSTPIVTATWEAEIERIVV